MSDSVKPEQQPDVKPLPVSAQRQAPSLLSTTRQFKFNGIVIGVLATIASVAFVYVKSATTKPAAQPAQPHLTAAPRKPVPELKAPLPDLFRPAEPPAAQVAAASVLDPLQVLQQQQEMQRAEKSRQLLEARLKSALDPGESQQGELIPKLPQAGQAAQAVLKPAASPNLGLPLQQDPNAGFERAVVGQGVPLAKAFGLSDPEYKILQGKVIEAITLPRIVSDLPGTVCALTQRDVYAERGRRILIPWGSRMCGVYNAELKKGQSRLFTVWNTQIGRAHV